MSSFHESGPGFCQLVTFFVNIYIKKFEKSQDTWSTSVLKLIIAYQFAILFTIKTLAM